MAHLYYHLYRKIVKFNHTEKSREKLTVNRIQVKCLNEKGIDSKRFYHYRQWLGRFKQDNRTNIRPLIRKETIIETDWNTKKIQDLFGHWYPKQHPRHTRSEYHRNRTISKMINYSQILSTEEKTDILHFFGRNNQTRKHQMITERK